MLGMQRQKILSLISGSSQADKQWSECPTGRCVCGVRGWLWWYQGWGVFWVRIRELRKVSRKYEDYVVATEALLPVCARACWWVQAWSILLPSHLLFLELLRKSSALDFQGHPLRLGQKQAMKSQPFPLVSGLWEHSDAPHGNCGFIKINADWWAQALRSECLVYLCF